MKKYSIAVGSLKEFHDSLKLLMDYGFLFSSRRINNLEHIKQRWGSTKYWRYIKVGDDYNCQKVLHAQEFGIDEDATVITAKDLIALDPLGKKTSV